MDKPIIPAGLEKHTPMMKQYLGIKAAHPYNLVFYRMGDFYELFFEDAEKAARLLGHYVDAARRNGGDPIKMAGIPFHAVDQYLAKLINKASRWRSASRSAIRQPARGRSSARCCASSRPAPDRLRICSTEKSEQPLLALYKDVQRKTAASAGLASWPAALETD